MEMEVKSQLKFTGAIKLPGLKELRDGNYSPNQPWAIRDGPVIKIKGEPIISAEKNAILTGGILTGTIIVKSDKRLFYSRKEGSLVGSICVDNCISHNQGWGTAAPLKLEPAGKRWVITIYNHPLDEIKSKFELIELPTRSTTRGGSTSSGVLAGIKIFVGENETPSGNHGSRFYFVSLPYEVSISRTSNKGNSREQSYKVEDFPVP